MNNSTANCHSSISLLPCDLKQKCMPIDVDNLKKAVYKSLRYCQAKTNKSLYISSRKTIELKKFQKNLANIVKKKSNELLQQINRHSQQMILRHEQQTSTGSKKFAKNLQNLEESLKKILETPIENYMCLKTISQQCQSRLQNYQNEVARRQDSQINLSKTIEKPFKQCLRQLATLKKALK